MFLKKDNKKTEDNFLIKIGVSIILFIINLIAIKYS